MTEFVTPPPLDPGDRVAIVSPASGLAAAYPAVYERGLDRIESVFDLEPVEFPTATMPDEELAADPAARARDVEEAFADPDIGGVVATIGGNDQIRILEHLDPAILRQHPTRFFGLSDNTNLAQYLWNQGIVSFYGGHVLTDFGCAGPMPEVLERWLRTALFDEEFGALEPAPRFTDEHPNWADPATLEAQPEMVDNPGWQWHGGNVAVEGRTWGGNLEITELQLVADRYTPPVSTLAGGVLLLETSEELPSPSMVRRTLLGMGERGLLSAVDGVLLGRVKVQSHEEARTPDERREYRTAVRDAVVETVGAYNPTAPVVCGVDFGHTQPNAPVPIGALARVDPATETISFSLP